MPDATRPVPADSLKNLDCRWIAARLWAMVRCPSKMQSHGETDIGQACLAHITSEKTMKKLLSIGLLTVCALAISEHQASAWVNAKFSIGLNWHLQSANNNLL